jgi:hypothetical protein
LALVDLPPDLIESLLPKSIQVVTRSLLHLLVHFEVSGIPTENALEAEIIIIESHQVHMGALVAMEGSVAILALKGGSIQVAAVALQGLGVAKLLECGVDIGPDVAVLIIPDNVVPFKTRGVEVDHLLGGLL